MKQAPLILRLFGILALVGLALSGPGPTQAQGDSHYFAETQHTVSGLFWQYWQVHGGLAQQGFPISEEIQEKSDLNGQTYAVQYFERAVFEKHPENQPPFNVLLSQLGTFRYKAKYGDAGAPGQQPATSNARYFAETKHTLGGKFRTYWETHGGLAQQGFPISDEFTEVSDLNHQSYTVQYFERAVFEAHTENQPPFDVLLSQIGTFQYRCKYQGGTCAGGAAPTATPPPGPTAPPAATATPAGPSADCSGIPASQAMTVTPNCAPAGSSFAIAGSGFKPGEQVGRYYTSPTGQVSEGSSQSIADDSGNVTGITFHSTAGTTQGLWAGTFEGVKSHHRAIAYFKITGPAPPPPSAGCDVSADKDGAATPSAAHVGGTITFTARGFTPGEDVSFWFTTPGGLVVGTRAPASGFVNPDGTIGPLPITIDSFFSSLPGRWAITFQGASSSHQSVIYFCVSP